MESDQGARGLGARRQTLVYLERMYAAASVAFALVMILKLGPVEDATNVTTVRILGAALFALGVGALGVARDPVRCSSIVTVQLIFATLTALSLAWKFAAEHSLRALYLLVPLVIFIVLLLVLLPATRSDGARRPSTSGTEEE